MKLIIKIRFICKKSKLDFRNRHSSLCVLSFIHFFQLLFDLDSVLISQIVFPKPELKACYCYNRKMMSLLIDALVELIKFQVLK